MTVSVRILGGKQMAHSGGGIEKSLIEGLFTEGWRGLKQLPRGAEVPRG